MNSSLFLIGRLPLPNNLPFRINYLRMIKTGDWMIPDLIKYLVSVQSTLQPIEIDRLRLTPAFPEEITTEQTKDDDGTAKKAPKFKASDLYEPLDVFRSLGLPIIDWRGKDGKHKWRSNSEEGTSNVLGVLCINTILHSKIPVQLGIETVPTDGDHSRNRCQGRTA